MNKSSTKQKMERFIRRFKRDWRLYVLISIPLAYLIIFNYFPMYGVQIAFRDFRPKHGILGSEWVGLKWFKQFLGDRQFVSVFSNTVILSLYSLFAGFPLPVIFALTLNCLTNDKYKKTVQTIAYLPHFISTTVMVSIVVLLLSPVCGAYGNLYRLFGGAGYPVDFRATAGAFRHLYVWSGVWQNLGWDSIIYSSALSAVSMELHEAAMIDGATRFKRVLHIDIPAILPTIGMMFLMRVTELIGVGFEKAYMLQSKLNLSTSEVLSTYTYKYGMSSFRDYSFGSAVGLFNTLVNLMLLLIANTITKKASDGEIALF